MRDIKFRGKPIDRNFWVYGSLVNMPWADNGLGAYFIYFHEKAFRDNIEVDRNTVSQYWRTVNNQDLYDGDIFESREFPDKPKWVVQYREKEGQFCIAHPEEINLKWIYPWQTPDGKWWEDFGPYFYIIGNIHDNPELLTQKAYIQDGR